MQGQGSSVEPLSETFEFDHRSGSNNPDMDQQLYWNSMLLNSAETQNLPNYILPPSSSDANMSYLNMAAQGNAGLSIWSSGGPSSSEHSLNQGNHDETKMEHGWPASLTTNMGVGQRTEGRRFEAANMLSLENVNINLNSIQVDDDQPLSQNPNLNDSLQNLEHNATCVGISGDLSHSGFYSHPYNPGLLESEHAPSSVDPSGDSSGFTGFASEDGEGRPGSSLDGRRLACKRKNIEGVHGQSSSSANANFFHQNETNLMHSISSGHSAHVSTNPSNPSENVYGANSSEEQLNPRLGTITRVVSDFHSSASVAGNAESSHRNFRFRINPANQNDISPPIIFFPGDPIRRSGICSPSEPSSHLITSNQSIESRPTVASSSSQSQPHIPAVPGLPRIWHPLPWNGVSNSRVGSSSRTAISEERLMAVREETNSRSMPRDSNSEHPVFVPTTEIRHMVQDSTNWNLASGSINIAGNVASTSRAGNSSGVNSLLGSTWLPHQNLPTQYSRNLSEVVRRSLFPSGGSEPVGQGSNIPLQRSSASAASQDVGHQSVSGLRGHQQQHTRSALLLDRQNNGVPFSMRSLAAREGRSRMISEIRNVLDLMRRGERFEDVFILDQSAFFGGVDLHDRHRDMRLDVDNMSYEELLALEEQIGNVSTGLSEETILKGLRQRRYSPLITLGASTDEEPCCICQEEYVEGEELGMLDCGHDFHTACIKQWLMHKNLCPICKTTALVT